MPCAAGQPSPRAHDRGSPSVTVGVIGAAALPVGSYMPSEHASGAVYEHERLLDVVDQALAVAGLNVEDVGAVIATQNVPATRQLGFLSFFASRAGIRASANLLEVSALGTTGATAFDLAVNEVALGHADVALALGVHFESQAPLADAIASGIRAVGDVDFQSVYGLSPISWYALDASRYLHDAGATRTELAAVAVKSRQFSRHNAYAQMRHPITVDEVLEAPPIVEPLGLLDVPARSDGVICVVVGRVQGGAGMEVIGRGYGHDGHHQMGGVPHEMTNLVAARMAVATALADADVTMPEVGVWELYAPCTITEVLATEAIGLLPRHHGAFAAAEGRTGPDGDVRVNPSGGCLGRGHPSNITGLYQVLEAWLHLTGRAGDRGIATEHALTLAEGGNYNTALAHLFRRAA